MDPVDVPAKFEIRSFTRFWDNRDFSFGWRLRTPNLGEEVAIGGWRWYRSRVLVSSYRSCIVTFPLSVCVSQTRNSTMQRLTPALCSTAADA